MSFPTANVDIRRERVAQLRLRGLSSREIARALAQGDKDGNGRILNPTSGLPYDHKTILADLDVLKAEWARSANTAIDEHISRQYAEINEIKKAAWAAKDPELALKALDREMKLLGTAKEKTGDTYNIYFGLVEQIVMLAQARNEDPQMIFDGIVTRLQRANG